MSSAPSAVHGSWRPCLGNWGRMGLPVGASDLPNPEAEPSTAQFLAGHRPRRIRRAISSWRLSTSQSPVRTSFTCPLSSTLGVEPVSLAIRVHGRATPSTPARLQPPGREHRPVCARGRRTVGDCLILFGQLGFS
jgi:hypothetical protein